MAVIARLPSEAVIAGFKGVIDYYVYYPSTDPEARGKGTPCARKWPRSPGHKRSEAVEAQWADFTDAVHLWNETSAEIQAEYVKLASGTPLSGRDLFIRGYMKGLFSYEPPA